MCRYGEYGVCSMCPQDECPEKLKEKKQLIIEELCNIGSCQLCRKLGLYGKCEESGDCYNFLKNYFNSIIELKEKK